MKTGRSLFTLFLISCTSLFGAASYDLIIDEDLSPIIGGQDFLTVHRGLTLTADAIIPPQNYPPRGFGPFMGRFVEIGFIWDPINYLMAVTQHEVFGHGYRIRDLGKSKAKVHGYEISVPPPYRNDSMAGATFFSITDKLTASEAIAIAVAGLEAEEILARQLKLKWIANQKVDPRTSSLYTISALSVNLYATGLIEGELEEEDSLFSSNDLKTYVEGLNLLYPDDLTSVSKLKSKAYLNLVDPAIFYAIYAPWYYFVTGKHTDMWMIPIGPVHYLPGLRLVLAPYGMEVSVENYCRVGDRPFYFYGKGGSHGGVSYWGAGFEMQELWRWAYGSLGLRFHLWHQPKFDADLRYRQKEF